MTGTGRGGGTARRTRRLAEALFFSDSQAPSFLAESQFYFQLQSVVIEKSRCFLSLVPCSLPESHISPSSQREEMGRPALSPHFLSTLRVQPTMNLSQAFALLPATAL